MSDQDWEQNDSDNDGWDEEGDENDRDNNMEETKVGLEVANSEAFDNLPVKIYEIKEVETKQIPNKIKQISELMGIDNDDTVLSILRNYNFHEENI